MKIKRFNENIEDMDISPERIGEMIEELKDFLSSLEGRNKMVESITSELENYKNQSKKGNDQIDDSIAALQIAKKDLDDTIDKIDTVINNMLDYNENGRKYLYTENK